MADEKQKTEKESKILLEREYVVPLRKGWMNAPHYKRANRAIKELKMFMARHMKVYDRDLRKIKIDIYLNNEIRFRGMKKPLAKIRVKAIKYESGIVEVKLVNLPKHIEFELARNAKRAAENLKKQAEAEKTQAAAKEQKQEISEEKKQETKEKEESSKLATEKMEKAKAQEVKHTSGVKKEPEMKRKALKK